MLINQWPLSFVKLGERLDSKTPKGRVGRSIRPGGAKQSTDWPATHMVAMSSTTNSAPVDYASHSRCTGSINAYAAAAG